MQTFDHPSKKVLITGVSGTGKTTLFEKLLRKEKARWKFIFDHQGEFSVRFGGGRPAAATVGDLIQDTARGGYVIFDPVEFCNEIGVDGERRGLPGAFAFFCDYVFAICETHKGRKIIACDELQKLVDTSKTPPELMTVLDTGRRYQLDFYGISQAPNLIHNAIRNQLTEIFTFRQCDKNAVVFLEDNGFNPDSVRNLQGHEYLWRSLKTGESNFTDAKQIQVDPPRKPSPDAAGSGATVENRLKPA